ncbi:Uncharacterised protein [Vibrio cholerae]|nr:Uncharacterised protein [Vibrio cholerae]
MRLPLWAVLWGNRRLPLTSERCWKDGFQPISCHKRVLCSPLCS